MLHFRNAHKLQKLLFLRVKINQSVIFQCIIFSNIWHLKKYLQVKIWHVLVLNPNPTRGKSSNSESDVLQIFFMRLLLWHSLGSTKIHKAMRKKVCNERVAYVCFLVGGVDLLFVLFMAFGLLHRTLVVGFALPLGVQNSLRAAKTG